MNSRNFPTKIFISYPITGSFSRTAVNAQSGVQTPAGGIVTGLSVVIATQFLTPAFKYIPTAALAAVIMLAAISMFDTDGVKHAWRVNKMDLFPLVVAFGICFYEIAVSLIFNPSRNSGRLEFRFQRILIAAMKLSYLFLI